MSLEAKNKVMGMECRRIADICLREMNSKYRGDMRSSITQDDGVSASGDIRYWGATQYSWIYDRDEFTSECETFYRKTAKDQSAKFKKFIIDWSKSEKDYINCTVSPK